MEEAEIMRTQRVFYPGNPIVYTHELSVCPTCQGPLQVAYTSGPRTVQSMSDVQTIRHQPRFSPEPGLHQVPGLHRRSAQWEQSAPRHCTFGYDVIAQIGWLRQMQYQQFEDIHASLRYIFNSASQRCAICTTNDIWRSWLVMNGRIGSS